MHWSVRTILGIMAAGALTGAWAEVYKWEGPAGTVHYGDRPAGDRAERLEIDPNPPAPGEPGRVDPGVGGDEEAMPEQAEAAPHREEADQQGRCRYAQHQLERYLDAWRFYEPDGSERPWRTEAERREGEAFWRGEVEQWCP
jgi:hypothetical protein